jgi:hypothetical protein
MFGDYVDCINPIEPEVTDTSMSMSYIDIHLEIDTDKMVTVV